MNESTWQECCDANSAITITPNLAKASSLIDTAEGRLDYLNSSPVNEKNANYVFEGYYSSVLELLHALLTKKGYKVVNHICVGFYIRDVLHDEELFRLFDDCRYKRNSLTYYGRKMDFDTAKDAIEKAKKIIQKLNKQNG